MKLNLKILQKALSANWHCRLLGGESMSLLLGRPRLYAPGVAIEENALYIVRSEDFPVSIDKRNVSLVSIGSQVPRERMNGGTSVLQIVENIDIIEVFNAVQQIFDLYETWDLRLRDELERTDDFDIRNLLLLGVERFQHRILISDHRMHVVLSAGMVACDGVSSPQITQETETAIDIEQSERIRRVCNMERKITTPYVSSIMSEKFLYYCNNLHTFGHYTGCVTIVSEEKGFEDYEYLLFDHFFKYMEKAYAKHLQTLSQTESEDVQALRQIFQGNRPTEKDRERFGLRAEQRWRCFQMKPISQHHALPQDYMCAMLNDQFPGKVYAMTYKELVVGMVRQEESADKTFRHMDEVLKRMDYCGGMSHSFADFDRIRDYQIQASWVMERFAVADGKHNLDIFDNHVLDYMLASCSGEMAMKSLYTDRLLSVMEYDSARHTDYIQTLNVFLKNEMSISQTATDLFIHRNSLIKRLEKLKQLLNSDLDNPDERLYLRLCLAKMNTKQSNIQ